VHRGPHSAGLSSKPKSIEPTAFISATSSRYVVGDASLGCWGMSCSVGRLPFGRMMWPQTSDVSLLEAAATAMG
jgi:hypothetical protein